MLKMCKLLYTRIQDFSWIDWQRKILLITLFFYVHKVAKSLKGKATQNLLHMWKLIYMNIRENKARERKEEKDMESQKSCPRGKYTKCNKKKFLELNEL